RMLDLDLGGAIGRQTRSGRSFLPGPGVAGPQERHEMQRCRRRATVRGGYLPEDIVGAGPGVFDRDVKITRFLQNSRIQQLEFRLLGGSALVFCYQRTVREGRLRVFVKHSQVGMARGGVEIVIDFLDVLAVIAFAVGQPEQPLLEDWIALVPQRKAEAPVKV